MPRISKELREQIKNLSHKELCEIVIKAAAREKSVYDYIHVNYLDKANGEDELFNQAKTDITDLFYKGYKGFSKELHPDYKIEYQDKINKYLEILHQKSNHLNFIYDLPKKI
ncbi:MAG: hypothetical protein HC831_07225 [Chloroflexia bacterium]|nr:hypothetical protein [Chloroflexia bacterium]